MGGMIASELGESEYKWVNLMDDVLELWEELSRWICEAVIEEVVRDIETLSGE